MEYTAQLIKLYEPVTSAMSVWVQTMQCPTQLPSLGGHLRASPSSTSVNRRKRTYRYYGAIASRIAYSFGRGSTTKEKNEENKLSDAKQRTTNARCQRCRSKAPLQEDSTNLTPGSATKQ
ncbi:unnamed protein product [Sphenostylis stenocarpa]|uniref:Uncharacterized protein n=1 Tax=Sphenostylis stenocarpa TaxID=92480 RepID=A0AA86SPD2_9FABA|nr:unnamed protein product [Sphenostylis stenocarpa]